eukprot:2993724-Pleurochrysis_carterae.AAC.6
MARLQTTARTCGKSITDISQACKECTRRLLHAFLRLKILVIPFHYQAAAEAAAENVPTPAPYLPPFGLAWLASQLLCAAMLCVCGYAVSSKAASSHRSGARRI